MADLNFFFCLEDLVIWVKPSLKCSCSYRGQTMQHMRLECPGLAKFTEEMWSKGRKTDLSRLLGTPLLPPEYPNFYLLQASCISTDTSRKSKQTTKSTLEMQRGKTVGNKITPYPIRRKHPNMPTGYSNPMNMASGKTSHCGHGKAGRESQR